MGRILAIDYGTKRCGIAVSDPLKMIANPLETVHPDVLLKWITVYCDKEDVERIVMGQPKRLHNEVSNVEQHIVGFLRKLQKDFPNLPVTRVDERFTSKIASAAMLAGGATKKQRKDKAKLDQMSAVVLLQEFLR